MGGTQRHNINLGSLALGIVLGAIITQLTGTSNPEVSSDSLLLKQSSTNYLDLPPSTKDVVLNIGSNKDPILPQSRSGPCAMTIAFEPMIPELVPAHPQVMVVPAAVSDSASLATMYKYNRDGVSSSLSKAAKSDYWNKNMELKIVPVVSMADVLQSIPPQVTIDFIQTDAQGFDFSIIQAGIRDIRKRGVKFLKTETYTDNVITYEGVKNDLCLHWIPFMTANGYTLVGTTVNYNQKFQTADKVMEACARQDRKADPKAGLKEVDALWKLSTVKETPEESRYAYPVLSGKESTFTEKDYETCKKLK